MPNRASKHGPDNWCLLNSYMFSKYIHEKWKHSRIVSSGTDIQTISNYMLCYRMDTCNPFNSILISNQNNVWTIRLLWRWKVGVMDANTIWFLKCWYGCFVKFGFYSCEHKLCLSLCAIDCYMLQSGCILRSFYFFLVCVQC